MTAFLKLDGLKILVEDSSRFSVKKPYNDNRRLYWLDEPTDEEIRKLGDILDIDKFLFDFYEYREKIWGLTDYKICEFGIAFDTSEVAKKIYYNINGQLLALAGKVIDGRVETRFKHYASIENYPKPQITKLLGEKQSIFEIISDYKPEYKEFFHDRTFLFFDERTHKDLNSLLTAEPNCYHANIRRLDLKIGENSELIKKLLKSQNCNVDNVDEWISKHSDQIIYWLSLLKDGMTIYYDKE
jgi:hypothetical protein